MNTTTPQLDAPLIVIAEEQEEYNTVTGALVYHRSYGSGEEGWNTIVLAFRPSDEERARIAAGDDLYVSQLTFGGSMNGAMVLVGVDEAAAVFNVKVAA